MLVAPVPKFQDQEVMEPVEVSVNTTCRGALPTVGVAVKLAASVPGGGEVVGVMVASFEKALSFRDVS